MKIIIRLAVLAALSSATVLTFGIATGRASTEGHAPWCAVVDQGAGNVMWECFYETVAECTPNVLAGNRGFCEHNPYYEAALPRNYQAAPPPGAGRWHYIGHGNYVGN